MKEIVTITFVGNRDALRKIFSLLNLLYHNGACGHSAVFYIDWDGDGADRFSMSTIDDEKIDIKPYGCGELRYIDSIEVYRKIPNKG